MRKITKSEVKTAKHLVEESLNDIKGLINEYYTYEIRIAGSAKYYLVVSDKSNHFDLDYQIFLTKNSKSPLNNPSKIKNKIWEIIRENIDIKAKNSSTAITFKYGNIMLNDETFHLSIDLVVMKEDNNEKQIIKRNINSKNTNAYTWNIWTVKYEELENILKTLDADQKNMVAEEIRDAKVREKKHPSNPPKSGTEIFSEIVGQYR